MNARHLSKMGVSRDVCGVAMQAVQAIAKRNRTVAKELRVNVRDEIGACVADPASYINDPLLADLAKAMIEDQNFVLPDPVDYQTWGADGIDEGSHTQMKSACALPVAVSGALMPDAHVGYGLPIGGVLALDNAVVPYAVGVDIACRMKMTVYPVAVNDFRKHSNTFKSALENGTIFGVGQEREHADHAVMDQDWSVTQVTRERKDIARRQLGTSGSGNHFVEWGVLFLDEPDLGLEAGEYIALLSHSGSRGAGAAVCKIYHDIARGALPRKYSDFANLAWLSMDSDHGQEYWAAMNLMGDYAAANHDVIHRSVAKLAGVKAVASIENHHNFAWLEEHNGRKVYVHRKGATPAGDGVLGVIPGSMGTPAYVVRGKGNASSLCSASHGAGRVMSRTQAKSKFTFGSVKGDLAAKGIEILSAGADEVPGVYKDIESVMAAQTDLVSKVARFEPRIVKMCGDDSRAED